MLANNLYDEILIQPATPATDLYIVAGYASATFARKHLIDLDRILGDNFNLHLIIGMPSKKSDHQAFLKLCDQYRNRFHAHYYEEKPPVHSKVYGWFNGLNPLIGFSGSGNYSQGGFFRDTQVNQFVQDNPVHIKSFYEELRLNSVEISLAHIEVPVFNFDITVGESVNPGGIEWLEEDVTVRISFLKRNGEMPNISGLNWGQRPGREANQAYLPIRGNARKIGFLPEMGRTFTMINDDDNIFDCVVQQQGRKAVSTTDNNSILGRYIRNRLNLKEGEFVSREVLIKYGRTDFLLKKLDDETFLFDMSPPKAGE